MEIRINKLRLHNFKGVRHAEYILDGQNARIEGPNGSGKSTVFDAFTWLLFGKDHRGQTADAFEIKTIDPATGEPFPREEHWVEAELAVDGRTTTLRRIWLENWVKPTGETEEVMRGHTSQFLVDGVDVGTKRSYDAVVNGWMNEDMFKMLTNPHYFIDDTYTHWKDRRKAIMELVKDAPGLAKVKEDFADVIDAMSGRSIEDFRKRLTMERNANKRDLEATQNKIAGAKETLPEKVDEDALLKQIADLKAQRDKAVMEHREKISGILKALAGGDGASSKRKAENDAIWAEITQVQLKMSNRLAEVRNAALEQNKAQEKALFEAKAYLATSEAKCNSAAIAVDSMKEDLDSMTTRRGKAATDLAELGAKYQEEKGRVFSYTAETKCPYCGQEIPAASIEEAKGQARQHFMAERKAAMDRIIKEAEAIKEMALNLDANLAKVKESIAASTEELNNAMAEVQKWQAEVKRLQDKPTVDLNAVERAERTTPEFRAWIMEEQDLRIKASNTAGNPEEKDDLLQEKARLESEISALDTELTLKAKPLRDKLAANDVRKRQLETIAQWEQQARSFANAIANAEILDAKAAEYVKAQIESVETAISSHFHVARWKMFDTTMDGGIVEMCEVTSPEGVPYKSMNDAMKILCGLDVIRAFGENYGRLAPIFIDNAESITQSSFDTPAQIVRLVVADIPEIKLTKE